MVKQRLVFFKKAKKSSKHTSRTFPHVSEGILFPNWWKVTYVALAFKNVGERSTAYNCRLVNLLSVISKIFEKVLNNKLVDRLKKCRLFLISIMILGLLVQLQTSLKFYLM